MEGHPCDSELPHNNRECGWPGAYRITIDPDVIRKAYPNPLHHITASVWTTLPMFTPRYITSPHQCEKHFQYLPPVTSHHRISVNHISNSVRYFLWKNPPDKKPNPLNRTRVEGRDKLTLTLNRTRVEGRNKLTLTLNRPCGFEGRNKLTLTFNRTCGFEGRNTGVISA